MAVVHKKKGNFLEDFTVGHVFRHKVGRTVSEGLLNAFTAFDMTTNPLSKNRRYAQRYGFKDMVLPPGLVMAVVFSQSVEDISENARANLEYINMRFGAPVYLGDTIEVHSIVLGVKPSSRDKELGVVHVQTTGQNQDGLVVLTYERKVQVWKGRADAEIVEAAIAAPPVEVTPWLPPYDRARAYAELAHLASSDTYFEDFNVGDTIEHSRGRTMTTEHIALTAMLDNTSQVHCNQHLIDQNPSKFLGGQLIIFGGIPFNLCLGLSCPDVGDNALADLIYTSGRHTGPLFAGETVFASTEIRAKREYPGRADLGVLATTLRGHKHKRDGATFEPVEIFCLERELIVKRRTHYA
ncbi:MAG: MaoC family dehydratase [Deltaproteobacteria bacterium]|nr:MaoC family dehydratase [Deltaproteobacteria bacterium]MBI3388692.1 MaoC family dehydratase [Deltaproteobacteria bacterium]